MCLLENGCLSEFGQCLTKRCDMDEKLFKCSENECCSKDGKCINIFEDDNDMCFIENGCFNGFNGKCLSYDIDINDINKYDKKYQTMIYDKLKNHCEKELKPYEEACAEIEISKINDDKEHSNTCNLYEKMECEEYYKSPYKYVPSCKYIKKINFDDENVNVSQNKMICCKKDSRFSDNYCFNRTSILSIRNLINSSRNNKIIKNSCNYETCHDVLLEYLKNRLNGINSELKRKNCEDFINYLLSEECTKPNNKCGKDNNNEKCSEDECCSKYGVCINVNNDYDEMYLIENGCQSEFGQCSTKRCDMDEKLFKCSEDEYCSKDGKCINIFKDDKDMCYLENGYNDKFSGQCLSYDINNINKYDEKYHDKILKDKCEKELNSYFEICKYDDFLTIYNENERINLCNNYKKIKCKKFLKSPYEILPFCKNNYDIILDYYDIHFKNIYCSKKKIHKQMSFVLKMI